jgi:2-polyprenyl-6-methoxyphenol hydroxylase-like FAD-dependent oxidoreductase
MVTRSGGVEDEDECKVIPEEETNPFPRLCPKCLGEGKISKPPSKKSRLRHKKKVKTANTSRDDVDKEEKAPRRWDPCPKCDQTGLLFFKDPTTPNNFTNDHNFTLLANDKPHVAIIGGGIGGLALAVALGHRQIPCHVYEKDTHFAQRSQGYGLTLQQARRALKSLGIRDDFQERDNRNYTTINFLRGDAVTSTKHVVHTIDGTIVGEWGLRKWGRPDEKKAPAKRQNLHVPRQTLRYALWESLREIAGKNSPACNDAGGMSLERGDKDPSLPISWGHKLVEIKPVDASRERNDPKILVSFEVLDKNGRDKGLVTSEVDLVVGCDGIRSTVRQLLLGHDHLKEEDEKSDCATPLRYLDCLVVLGICPLDLLEPNIRQLSPLLDGETVFQTADGTTRIYVMPYSKTKNEYMWQLSFPVPDEGVALTLSRRGPAALKQEALNKCKTWHSPIPEILRNTPVSLVSGYPVYDRDLLSTDILRSARSRHNNNGRTTFNRITLLGDAAHPMSPCKYHMYVFC